MFSITCNACAARLKVRNVAIIGQTLSCPRCGEMIPVIAPPGFVLPESPADSGTSSVSKIDSSVSGMTGLTDFEDIQAAIDDAAGKTEPPPPKESATRLPRPRTEDGTSPLAMPPNRAEANRLFVAAESRRQRKVAAADADRLSKPKPNGTGAQSDWSSERVRKQKTLFLGLFGLVFLVVAVGGLIWVLSQPGESKTAGVAQINSGTVPAVPAANSGADNSPDNNAAIDAAPNETGNSNTAPATDNAANPDVTNQDGSEKSNPDSSAPQTTAPNSVNPTTGPPPIDGLDGNFPADLFSPGVVNDGTSNEKPASDQDPLPGAGAQSSLIETNLDSIPDALGELAALLSTQGNSLDDLGSAARAANSTPPGMPTFYVPRPASVPPPNLEKSLAVPVGKIAYREVRLSVVLRELSQLAGIPVAWDIRAVIDAGIDPQTPITIELADTTIGEAFNAAVSQAGLEVFRTDSQTWGLAIVPAGDSTVETVRIPLTPTDEARTAALAKEIPVLVAIDSWDKPESNYSVTFEGAELVVRHNRRVIREIKRMADRINRVAAEPTWSPTSRNRSAQSTLDDSARLALTFVENIESFLGRLESETSICILLDWSTVTEAGWNLKARIPGDFSGDSNRQLLNRLARSMELDWQPIGENVFLLTTEKASNRTIDVEVYAAGSLIEKGQLDSVKLMRIFSETIGASLQPDTYTNVYFDDPTGCIIVAAPPNVQRQVEAVLNQLLNPPAKDVAIPLDNPLGIGR